MAVIDAPLRIAVLNYEYPPIGGGGGEVSKFLAEGYAARGHRVRVLTARWGDLPPLERVGENLEIERIFSFRRAVDRCTPAEMTAFLLLGIPAALRLARRWQPDVVHAHFALPVGPLAYAVQKRRGFPYVLTFHGGDVPGHYPEETAAYFRLTMPLVRRVVAKAHRAVAVSHGLLALCEKSFATSNLDCIPNGVDVEVFRPDPEKPPVVEPDAEGRLRPVRVIFAGRFSPQKKLNRLIEAAKILRDRGITAFGIDLYGGGPTESELKMLTAREGLEGAVRFPGWVSREELGMVLGQSDLFVLPSDKEGMPIACLQAMAAGMAVVGSRTLGIEEVVEEEKTGLLIGIGDVKGLADSLERLITRRDELARMGREGRALAYERFRWDVIIDQYLALLGEAVLARRSREE